MVTKKNPATKREKNGSARAVLPLRWSATEYAPQKRWWWFVGLSVVSLWLCGLALALQIWSLLAVIIATTLVFFVMYTAKPRVWDYELTKKEIRISSGTKKLMLPLAKFRAFTVEELPRAQGSKICELIVLLPCGRLRPASDVYLTDNVERNMMIVEGLTSTLAYDEAQSYLRNERYLNRFVRFLRIG